MIILLTFAFISGLITIFAPCIWPLLPIILSASAGGGKKKPLGITLGIITSFTVFTLTISYIVKIFPFDPDALRLVAVVIIGFLGLTLAVPQLSQVLEGYVSRLSGRLGNTASKNRTGFTGGFVTGFSLGLVWSPCAGPILATIATLAATQAVNFRVILITLAYVTGVGIPLFLFATIGGSLFTRSRFLSKYTGRIQQVFGVIMILTAVAIYTGFDRTLQARLLDYFPSYSEFIYKLEGNKEVKKELDKLKQQKDFKKSIMNDVFDPSLPDRGNAPEFAVDRTWLNTDAPLTMEGLRGKVVLIDFWTYSCINCIRTLPYVTGWYEKYKDMGFVVVGVHTPEFEFEKKTANVSREMLKYKINYPVVQDNDYAIWESYSNRYWPAKYLVDAKGVVRYYHFGEGSYKETEQAIQELLAESGKKAGDDTLEFEDQGPKMRVTPELYLGSARSDSKVTGTGALPLHRYVLDGSWDLQEEAAVSKKGSSLTLRFYAKKVFLVITPRKPGDTVTVILDDKPVKTITLDSDRLYDIVELPEYGDHVLKLEFPDEGTAVYAFTFG